MRSDRDLGFTDEQLLLRDAVRQFVREEVPDSYARRCDHDQITTRSRRSTCSTRWPTWAG
jgi:hypothetical protein